MALSRIEKEHPERQGEFVDYILETSSEIFKAGGDGNLILSRLLANEEGRGFLFISFLNNLRLRFEPPKQRKGFDEEFEDKEEDSENDDGGNL